MKYDLVCVTSVTQLEAHHHQHHHHYGAFYNSHKHVQMSHSRPGGDELQETHSQRLFLTAEVRKRRGFNKSVMNSSILLCCLCSHEISLSAERPPPQISLIPTQHLQDIHFSPGLDAVEQTFPDPGCYFI